MSLEEILSVVRVAFSVALPLLELRNDLLLLAGWLSSDAEIWIKSHTKIEYLAAPIITGDCTTDAFVFDRNF